MTKLLAVDIGNTNINFGVFSDKKLLKTFIIPTKAYTPEKLIKRIQPACFDLCVVCSVVPSATRIFSAGFKKYYSRKPYIIGKDIIVPIRNCYRNPRQVGQDRLVNAYAGILLYGAPLITLDFGTAITFDVISKKKEYLGGMICPGLGISLEALSTKTALLPKIKLDLPREFIGRDTKNSILSGMVYGYAGLCDELVRKIKTRIGNNARVIGTGGNITFIKPFCKGITAIDKDLTLKGIRFTYEHAFTHKKA